MQMHVPDITQGLPLSFVKCRQRYPTIQQSHYPCREHRAVPLSCSHPLRQCLISLPLLPTILHYFMQIMAMWGKQNQTIFLRQANPYDEKPGMLLSAAVRTRLQGEPWCPRESIQERDFATAPTSGHFQWLVMGNRIPQALVFAQLWSIKM